MPDMPEGVNTPPAAGAIGSIDPRTDDLLDWAKEENFKIAKKTIEVDLAKQVLAAAKSAARPS